MPKVVRGEFRPPEKPIEASFGFRLEFNSFADDAGEEYLAVRLDGDVVGIVPIEPGTAPPEPKKAKLISLAKKRIEKATLPE